MFSFDKIAAVGDADLLFGLRALGVKVFSPREVNEARRVLERIDKEKFALCLVHQDWLQAMSEEKKAFGKKFGPVIVGFSDYRTLADTVEKMVKKMAVRATGSDALIKGKGKDESS